MERSSPHASETEADSDSEQDELGEWMDAAWRAELASRKALKSTRKAAPRTIAKKLVYDADSLHNVLHRPAAETRKAFSNAEVRFETADGTIKAGNELTDADLQYGPCHVCKQVRAVAPTKHSKGVTSVVCGTCHLDGKTIGATYAAPQ